MTPRLDYIKADPVLFKAMLSLQERADGSGLEPELLDIVKVRASQINGCAFCIDMHTKEARARGETEQRLYALNAWAETPFFDARERAALAWTEAITLIHDNRVPDELYANARQQFDEESLVRLTYAIVAINAWNRICVSFRVLAGSYQLPPERIDAPRPTQQRSNDNGSRVGR
jgi:AhpD family alkylhydroperoxidase